GIPWIKGHDPVPLAECEKRARAAVGKMVPRAEKLGVSLNIENIFFNGYLLSPRDMIEFVDGFKSKHVRVHFDTGNISEYQQPQDWVRALGGRTANVHLKEYDRNSTDHSLACFRTLLDGTTDWPGVLEAFDEVGYKGYLTFEYFHPFAHYPEALIHQTSDALDRILGRKR
ncbi:MAG: sugar phosphate isomerase/epimerase family protein, partial [Gemmataceae bacterium]